jgi:hypothetical protein
MHSLVEQIEEMFLPTLNRLALEMQQRHPELIFAVWSSPTGTLTDYKGHDLGVECCFQQSSPKVASVVALSIDVCHLTSTPRVMLEVGWAHPSGHVEASYPDDWSSSDEWPTATPEVLNDLKRRFPDFIRAFQLAVERGAPN